MELKYYRRRATRAAAPAPPAPTEAIVESVQGPAPAYSNPVEPATTLVEAASTQHDGETPAAAEQNPTAPPPLLNILPVSFQLSSNPHIVFTPVILGQQQHPHAAPQQPTQQQGHPPIRHIRRSPRMRIAPPPVRRFVEQEQMPTKKEKGKKRAGDTIVEPEQDQPIPQARAAAADCSRTDVNVNLNPSAQQPTQQQGHSPIRHIRRSPRMRIVPPPVRRFVEQEQMPTKKENGKKRAGDTTVEPEQDQPIPQARAAAADCSMTNVNVNLNPSTQQPTPAHMPPQDQTPPLWKRRKTVATKRHARRNPIQKPSASQPPSVDMFVEPEQRATKKEKGKERAGDTDVEPEPDQPIPQARAAGDCSRTDVNVNLNPSTGQSTPANMPPQDQTPPLSTRRKTVATKRPAQWNPIQEPSASQPPSVDMFVEPEERATKKEMGKERAGDTAVDPEPDQPIPQAGAHEADSQPLIINELTAIKAMFVEPEERATKKEMGKERAGDTAVDPEPDQPIPQAGAHEADSQPLIINELTAIKAMVEKLLSEFQVLKMKQEHMEQILNTRVYGRD